MASVDLHLEGTTGATGAAQAFALDHSSPHPLKLYGGWFCPFVQRAWVVLAEKNIQHQYIEINPYKKAPEFLALNPRGLVPTLAVPDGITHQGRRALYESSVICEFLDEEFSDPAQFGPRLLPEDDAYERARCRLWMNHIATKIVPAFYRFLQHQEGSGYSLDEIRREFVKHLVDFVREMLATDAEEGREKGPWFSGARFSLVDIYLLPWARRIWLIDHYKEGRSGVPEKGAKGLSAEDQAMWERWWAWMDAVLNRDSIKKTWSDDSRYIDVYKRYAENTTQSEVAKATREGRGLP